MESKPEEAPRQGLFSRLLHGHKNAEGEEEEVGATEEQQPATTTAQTAPKQPKPPQMMVENPTFEEGEQAATISMQRVAAERLLRPQEVEAGLEKPQLSTHPLPEPIIEGEEEGKDIGGKGMKLNPTTTPTTATTQQQEQQFDQLTPPQRAAARLEAAGFRRGRIIFDETQQQQATTTTKQKVKEKGRKSPTFIQGERIKVSHLEPQEGAAAAAPTATTTKSEGRIPEVEARPSWEVQPISSPDVLESRARQHALRAQERQRAVDTKQHHLEDLRRQAKSFEEESQAILHQAAEERERVSVALEKTARYQHAEWRGYAQAEDSEHHRRQVIVQAQAPSKWAEDKDVEALKERQLASDLQYHAEVLNRRARSLIEESKQMAEVSLEKIEEAGEVSVQLGTASSQVEELKGKMRVREASGMREYIEQCRQEKGRLAARMRQLDGEIDWAELQLDKGQAEADDYRRILVGRQSHIASLILKIAELREDSRAARDRSKAAAEEAVEPAQVSHEKYEQVQKHLDAAERLEKEAKQAEEEALNIAKAAVEPTRERQQHLREAAAAEMAIKSAQQQADLVVSKLQRELHEAEVKAERAREMAERAEELEREVEFEKMGVEGEREMEESYREELERGPAVPPVVAI
jgi:hypothetical protein